MPFDPSAPDRLLEHFEFHGQVFGAKSAQEYEQMADQFMTKTKDPEMYECLRLPECDVVCRYDPRTKEFGTMFVIGKIILTYFKPVPGSHLREGERPYWMHPYRTNLDYFNASCC